MNKVLQSLVLLLGILMVPAVAYAQNTYGDVNSDGEINIADVNAVIDVILDGTGYVEDADVNNDGEINIADINTIINIILGGTTPEPPVIETITVNGVSFNMVKVEGGTFMMGASDDDTEADNNEKPAHQVTLSTFNIGETEVTQALWQAVMGTNPSFFSYTDDYLICPVENVQWSDCQIFITKLSEMTGKSFRLPTEAEWEYAARGGNKSMGYKYSGSNDINQVAWWRGNDSYYRTYAVATKAPNELGLYDMSGNVQEWCQDQYDNYTTDPQTDPIVTSGTGHVRRGGSFFDIARDCRVTERHESYYKDFDLGLRLFYDDNIHLSVTVLKIFVGQSRSIAILNGKGDYAVEGGEEYVSCTISGNTLTVTGTNTGTATVHITDNSTGSTVELSVTVEPALITETFTVNGVSFNMVKVEGGTFMMGATDEQISEVPHYNESPAHQVTLSSYCIGQTEVTQALWQAVMGNNPSSFTSDLNNPVEMVSWIDCQEFISKLNQMTGKTFRLPTEAEWEYAARGGNKSKGYIYAGSNDIDEVAWYKDNHGIHTNPVAIKAPNELGLYDMSGNVEEWCQDWFGYYSSEAQTNPTGPSSGNYRIFRGGNWNQSARDCRVSHRYYNIPDGFWYHVGLRLVLSEEDNFRLSHTVVKVIVGESMTVDILNGNGDYSVEGGEGYVTSTISGNTLTVTGANRGVTTVHVTDNATGSTTVLVVVVEPAPVRY